MKKLLPILSLLLLWCSHVDLFASSFPHTQPDTERIVVAYITSWSDVMPNTSYITHINYAFGHVSETFNGVRIDNVKRLKELTELNKVKPELKVLLSVGGWGSGRFSEMAASATHRMAFAKSCRHIVKELNLDGIDIDWEYPTSHAAGISASPEDTDHFTLLMHDLRNALGPKKLLTLATIASAEYIDFQAILPYIDFVNVMAYDMGRAPLLHSALYPSAHTGSMSSSAAIEAHLQAGVPASELVMGMPFYGRGGEKYPDFQDYNQVHHDKTLRELWDETAKVPYLIDSSGEVVFGFENPRSIRYKCQFIKEKKLLGGMYWDYAGDTHDGALGQTVYQSLIEDQPLHDAMHQVLILTESAGQHKAFSDAALQWLIQESTVQNLKIQVLNSAHLLADPAVLAHTDLVIQLDFPPYTWPKEAEKQFEEYIHEGKGAWIGFHHATLLGEFDGYPLWQWFSDFMGGIQFADYIAPLADGTVVVEQSTHPVMQGVAPSFVVPDDEWYTYHKSPRPHVKVLAHVDESTYQPASNITMGDHPVIWINPHVKAKNIYFQMGHSPKLFHHADFTLMLHNAIQWTLQSDDKDFSSQ